MDRENRVRYKQCRYASECLRNMNVGTMNWAVEQLNNRKVLQPYMKLAVRGRKECG